jgi:hypothetical protein
MNCPHSEWAAPYADGRLDPAEAARYLEHCADCDECRRTTAILHRASEGSSVPAALEQRAIAAIRRSLDRDRTPRAFRRVSPASAPASPSGLLVAAALLVGFVGIVLMAKQRPARVTEPREIAQRPAPPAPAVLPEPEPVPAPEPPKVDVTPKPEPIDVPRPPAPKFEEPKPEVPAETIVREIPKADETRVEEPPKTAAHTVAARALSEVQVTDIAGALTVNRKGGKARERLSGVARLAEGDVLSADKGASFQIEGRHPVVLAENTSISMAYVPQEQAPWINVHSGEAIVDSTSPSRWVVTDGQVAVSVKPAKARFTASRKDSRLALAAHTETLYLQPDGGVLRSIHPGEELQVSRTAADVRAVDASVSARRAAAFESARPRQRTVFYTSCDPADAKREHFFVQDGTWYRNEALLSRERQDRTSIAAIAPNPRFAWRDSLALRFRYMTNCKSVEVQMRVDEKKYTLVHPIAVDRKSANQWLSVEIPFALSGWPTFRRDDNGTQLVVSTEDKFDAIRFIVRQQDAYSDPRGYVLIDDIQVVEKEKE